MIAEEQDRARWEADYHARQQEQQQQHSWSDLGKTPQELDAMYNSNIHAHEAGDGRPRPAELPSRSTSSTLRNSEIGTAYKQPLTVFAPVGPKK